MMIKLSVVLLALLVAVSTIFCRSATAASGNPYLPTVSKVDLQRYMGVWHEIARLEHHFQKNCIGSSAEYSLREDGEVTVINRCIDARDGNAREAKGRAWSVDPIDNSKLKVTFFWPFRGDYWIIELGENYQYSVVGAPNRKYLWILARESDMEETVYSGIIERLRGQGFPVDNLIRRPAVPNQEK
jgi:apolipoprotein D and lipocalin family protein